ncbi:hypothetical protein HanIR_Chr10g0474541 [Helianthus annuus]|nr:hypothetical protein HanIR_Chr10g0474541 [Helianthus annuus]
MDCSKMELLTKSKWSKVLLSLGSMLWPNRWNTLAEISVNGIYPSGYYMFQINKKFVTWRDF